MGPQQAETVFSQQRSHQQNKKAAYWMREDISNITSVKGYYPNYIKFYSTKYPKQSDLNDWRTKTAFWSMQIANSC